MCLAIPSRVLKINRNIAEIESLGVLKKVDITLVPEVRIGDYVIVHAGFAIQVIDEKEALLTETDLDSFYEAGSGCEDENMDDDDMAGQGNEDNFH